MPYYSVRDDYNGVDLSHVAIAELRARMGRAGRETVATKFDLRKNVSPMVTSYGIS